MDQKTKVMISKCKTVDEVLDLAKSNNINLDKSKAEEIFKETHCNSEALSDSELSNVSGGYYSGCDHNNCYKKIEFSSKAEATFILEIGQEVQVFNGCGNCTYTKVIDNRKIQRFVYQGFPDVYLDVYHLAGEDAGLWRTRNEFEMPR